MTEANIDMDYLSRWQERTRTRRDTITISPARRMAATLDVEHNFEVGDPLPPLWHWLYCLPDEPTRDLDADGHAQRGAFLPPVPLPRRMWAGGRLLFGQPLRIGEAAECISTVTNIEHKQGRSGPLVFVNVLHTVVVEYETCISEEQTLVYRGAPRRNEKAPQPQLSPTAAQWSHPVTPDPVLLFRYSALTFNGHRIHYDRVYCKEHEGYPGLVVHGPLTATLLLHYLKPWLPAGKRISSFTYRAISPLFDTEPFRVEGRVMNGEEAQVWAVNAQGHLAMQGDVTFVEVT